MKTDKMRMGFLFLMLFISEFPILTRPSSVHPFHSHLFWKFGLNSLVIFGRKRLNHIFCEDNKVVHDTPNTFRFFKLRVTNCLLNIRFFFKSRFNRSLTVKYTILHTLCIKSYKKQQTASFQVKPHNWCQYRP
jgi:hypothetical protein